MMRVNFDVASGYKDAVVLVANSDFAKYACFLANQIISKEKSRKFDVCVLYTSKFEPKGLHTSSIRFGVITDIPDVDLKTSDRITYETYMRIFLPYLMQEYRRIIYIDCDVFLRRAGLQALFDLDMEGNIIAGVQDAVFWGNPQAGHSVSKYLRRINQSVENYFNAGVLLVDVARYVSHMTQAEITNALRQAQPKLKNLDQSFLNLVFSQHTKLISPIWNFQMTDAYQDGVDEFDPVLLHFCGLGKGWLESARPCRKAVFEEYAAFLSSEYGQNEFPRYTTEIERRRALIKHANPVWEYISRRKIEQRVGKAVKNAPLILQQLKLQKWPC